VKPVCWFYKKSPVKRDKIMDGDNDNDDDDDDNDDDDNNNNNNNNSVLIH
jgi:hypothetical protein